MAAVLVEKVSWPMQEQWGIEFGKESVMEDKED